MAYSYNLKTYISVYLCIYLFIDVNDYFPNKITPHQVESVPMVKRVNFIVMINHEIGLSNLQHSCDYIVIYLYIYIWFELECVSIFLYLFSWYFYINACLALQNLKNFSYRDASLIK